MLHWIKNFFRFIWLVNRVALHNLICGFHSGFPVCCVLHFSFLSYAIEPFFPRLFWRIKFFNHLVEAFIIHRKRSWPVGYVRCPLCKIRDKRVKVISCKNKKHRFGFSKKEHKEFRQYIKDEWAIKNVDYFDDIQQAIILLDRNWPQ